MTRKITNLLALSRIFRMRAFARPKVRFCSDCHDVLGCSAAGGCRGPVTTDLFAAG